MQRILVIILFTFSCVISASPQSAIVIAENANLLGTPQSSGRIVDTLAADTLVDIIRQDGGWYLVQSADFAGWIHGNTIKLLSSTTVAPFLSDLYQRPRSPPDLAPRSNAISPSGSSSVVLVPVTVTPALTEEVAVKTTQSAPDQSQDPVGATGKCADGTYSHSVGKQGACSNHGGVAEWFEDTNSRSPKSTPPTGGTVQVKGYTRKDGTYVAPHTRRAPRRK